MNATLPPRSMRRLVPSLAPLRKWLFAALATFAVFGFAPEALAQTTVTLTSNRDSHMYNNSKGANVNYGACNFFYVGGQKSEIDRGILGFDLTSLPANITITSAVLRLTNLNIAEFESDNRSVAVHPVTQAWTEGTGGCYPQTSTTSNVSWNNRTGTTGWSTAGGTFGAAIATTTVGGVGQYNWTITSQAQAWYNNPSANNGLVVKYASESSSRYKNFGSKENATPGNRPQLIVTYTLNCTTILGGALAVCVDSTANVFATPSTGGTWTSLNPGIATVTATGIVTGVAPGTATLRFTQGSCTYNRTITVNGPTTLGGATSLCAGSTAGVTPTSGGTWSSNNTGVATVTNAGVVTGVAGGTATLTFTNSNGCASTRVITVNALTILGGADSACVGATANVTPATGGTWTSLNTGIATVTSSGLVTTVSPGTATLRFTNSSGCVSEKSFSVTARPTLGGASAVCPGQTANVTPNTGGTWVSSDTAVATVTNAGVVTGVSAGTVTLTFTNTATGCTNTRSMTVNPQTTLGGSSSTCVGISALVTPNTGGTWISSSPAVATVTNAGVVSGVSPGSVTLSFTNSTTGCVSTKSFTVSAPLGGGGGEGIGGATAVCAGFQTNVTPVTGGTWSTSDPAIATVSATGQVTGFSPGTVVLTFLEDGSGCVSTVDFTVYPNVVAGGASSVCQGAVANVTPTTNGTWVSSDPAIAFVNNSGFVTGLQPGTVTLTFTSLGGCSDSKSFTVHPKPTALGAASVQVGQTAIVTPTSGGTWVSSNTAVATVTDAGVVSGVSEGSVTLTFTDSVTGCSGTKAVTVIDPGFYKNIAITDSGDKTDPDPENNTDPEVVFPQSYTALIVTVFQDLDGDGDGDEPVPNVTITVRDSEGTVVAVVTTGLDGSYTFDDLPPGFYTVTQTVPNGNFTLGDNPISVSVEENETVRADFVNSQLGQISGTVFADAGDEVMPDVLITLLDENGAPVLDGNGDPITTTTNSGGFYVFDLVPPGTYQVQQTVPNGYTAVDDVDGGDLTINGDVTPIVIAPGTVVTGQDFVNFLPGSISGNISIDTDLNLSGNEPHVGVTVALLDASGNPVLDGNSQPITTVTDAEGNYSFTGLDPGDYRVAQTVPTGFTAVADSDGGDFTVVGDVTLLSVAAGQNETADFVNQPQTDIQVTKIADTLTPVVGSDVTFTVTVTNNGPQNATDVKVEDVGLGLLYVSHTTLNGSFDVDPGAPTNTFSGLWTVGALNVGESATLTVVAKVTPDAIVGAYKNSVNAYSELGDPIPENNEDEVELNPVLGTISGNVSRDTTGDSLGNSPVQGVTVALFDSSGNPVLDADNVPLTTVTDAAGNYSFTGLPPGDYRVVETVPAGDVPVNDVDGGNLAINGDVTPISLGAGQTVADQNFVIAAVGSIAGTITDDISGDKTGDGPLAGVIVILLQSDGSPVLDGNGDAITTITDASGDYIFPGITPGDYRVAHVPPAGMIAVNDIDGGDLTVNGDITPIAVLPGQDVTGQDFVDSALGSISGSVLADSNNDGEGDVGIPGVAVALVNASNVTIATATTNSLGQYTFTNVPPGVYTIVETQPAGYSSVSDVDGGDLDIIGDVAPISLLPGEVLTDQTFVEILNATITGIVDADTTGDGEGDTPLEGVLITLLDENDDVVATTTTAADGSYSFPDVLPGDYTVVQTNLSGYISLTPDSVPASLLPGGSAFVPFTDTQLGTISGIVDADTTGDGNGDTPLEGVTVTLLDEDDNVVATTTTGPDGSYSFPNVPTGEYTVVQTDLPGYISLTDNEVPVTVTPGGTEQANFTDTQVGSIAGVIQIDTSGDGLGDDPQPGVNVALIDSNGDTVATTTTDSNGAYEFTGVVPGDYSVVQTVPTGFNAVNDVDGGDLTINGDQTPISVTPGAEITGQDFVNRDNLPPVAIDDEDLGNVPGTPVTVNVPANDVPDTGRTLDPTSVLIDGAIPASAGKWLIVPGEGFWAVDVNTGQITFFPESGFTLDPTPIQYTIKDDLGNESNLATVTIDYVPVASDDQSLDNPFGSTVTINVTANDTGGDTVVPTTVVIVGAPGTGKELEVPGQGTWTVDPVTGAITFIPAIGYTGDPDPISYTVEDAQGNVSNPALVTITYTEAPLANNDEDLGNVPGTPVTLDAPDNDVASTGRTIDRTTVQLTGADGGSGGKTLTVPGEGVWTVNVFSGEITFTPESGFTLDPTPITYTIQDDLGNVSNLATVTVDYVPVASDDQSIGNDMGDPVTLDVTANDVGGDTVDPTTVQIVGADPGSDGLTKTVDGEGVWTVDPLTGEITFTPEVDFNQNPTPITYTVEDFQGNVSNEASVIITYLGTTAITGTVFNDENGLTDNTVNGVGTNAAGIFINLVAAATNEVVASIPVNADGTYMFTSVNGLADNTSYLLILTTDQVTPGDVLTESTLPLPWASTGENLGAGPGSDGTVDGILAAATTVGPVEEANFGIRQVPDLTPVITSYPAIMNGPTNFGITIRVTELNIVDTGSTIIVRVPKDPRWSLDGVFDPTLTNIEGVPLNNTAWTYSDDPANHIFTSNTVIPAGGFSMIGFRALWNAGPTIGVFTLTSQIAGGSGGEVRTDNNVDAEAIDYFTN